MIQALQLVTLLAILVLDFLAWRWVRMRLDAMTVRLDTHRLRLDMLEEKAARK